MEVDKFKEDFFVEIPFKSLFIEPLPNESVLHRKRLDIAESKDTSNSSKVFIDVRAIIATVDKSFVHSFPVLKFTARTVSIRHSEVRNLCSKHSLSIIESYVSVTCFITNFFPM